MSPLWGFTLLNVLLLFVAADVLHPPLSEYEDVHIRFKRANF